MIVSGVLNDALRKIEKPENWCQGRSALDSNFQNVAPDSDKACRWCMGGAIQGSCSTLSQYNTVTDWIVVSKSISIAHFNDNHTHTEVIKLMKQLITVAKIEGV